MPHTIGYKVASDMARRKYAFAGGRSSSLVEPLVQHFFRYPSILFDSIRHQTTDLSPP